MRITAAVTEENVGGIARRLASLGPAVGQVLGEAVIRSSEPYVPYRTGRLASSVTLEVGDDGTCAVRWTAPYAAECYYADRTFSRRIHPLATARWFEAAKASDCPAWIAAAQEAVNGGGGAGGGPNENGGIQNNTGGRMAWKY